MALPPRVFFTIFEAAVRWGCTPTDIAEWAATERLQLTVGGVSFVRTDTALLRGLVEVHAADLMPMFHRHCPGPDVAQVFRVRAPGEAEWGTVFAPEDGLPVAKADLRITSTEIIRFEEENDLVRRAPSATPTGKYNWDAMYVAAFRRVYEHGLPASQAEFIGEVQEWFARRDPNGDTPDERSIRRRLNPIWKSLREAS